jgi:hypothetical protein
MPVASPEDQLSGNRQVILILRLVLDRQAQLRHGELLDAEAHLEGRFAGLDGLTETVGRWLARQRDGTTLDEDAPT